MTQEPIDSPNTEEQAELPPEPGVEPGVELDHDSDDVTYPTEEIDDGDPNESAETEDEDEGEGPTEE